MAMHVIQLLPPLLLAPDIQIVESSLPDSIRPVPMHAGGQPQQVEHSAAPGECGVFTEGLQYELGRSLFERLNNLRGVGPLGGPDQEMEMFWHEDVCEDFEIAGAAKLVQGLDKMRSEALRVEKTSAAVGAGR
jgi:hypothetical protein